MYLNLFIFGPYAWSACVLIMVLKHQASSKPAGMVDHKIVNIIFYYFKRYIN